MFNTPSPSDNELRTADTSIPNSDELAYDIVKSLERQNDEDIKTCDINIRERNKIIDALQSNCDHNHIPINKNHFQCRKCAHIKFTGAADKILKAFFGKDY